MFITLKHSSEDGYLKHIQYKRQCYTGIKKSSMHSKEGTTGIFFNLLNQMRN